MRSRRFTTSITCLLLLTPASSTSVGGDASRAERVAPSALAGAAAGDQSAHAEPASWAEILGRAIVLNAQDVIEDVDVSLDVGRVDAGGWFGAADAPGCEITFRRSGAGDPAATYIIAPWQRLSWKGVGALEDPSVITVMEHAIVLGPILGPDQGAPGRTLTERSYRHVADIVGRAQHEVGTTVDGTTIVDSPTAIRSTLIVPVPIYDFKPCYIRAQYPSGPPVLLARRDKLAFSAVVQKRMLLVIQERHDPKAPGSVVQYEWFPPAPIDRDRPRPFDPGEQRPGPGVDLQAAGVQLDRSLREVIDDALARVIDLRDRSRIARLEVYEAALPALEEAVFAYPGHSGPAHAAGAAALEQWQTWLKSLLLESDFTHDVEGHWPATLPVYRPVLIDQLRALPPAAPEHLPKLLQLFARYQSLAAEHPGRWNAHPPAAAGESRTYEPSAEELLLAEIGDRARTTLQAMPAEAARDIIATNSPGLTSLSYRGFDVHIHDPLGDHIYWVSEPIEIAVRLP